MAIFEVITASEDVNTTREHRPRTRLVCTGLKFRDLISFE